MKIILLEDVRKQGKKGDARYGHIGPPDGNCGRSNLL